MSRPGIGFGISVLYLPLLLKPPTHEELLQPSFYNSSQIQRLWEAVDADNSGGLDKEVRLQPIRCVA